MSYELCILVVDLTMNNPNSTVATVASSPDTLTVTPYYNFSFYNIFNNVFDGLSK